jgi:hypothetical protein
MAPGAVSVAPRERDMARGVMTMALQDMRMAARVVAVIPWETGTTARATPMTRQGMAVASSIRDVAPPVMAIS